MPTADADAHSRTSAPQLLSSILTECGVPMAGGAGDCPTQSCAAGMIELDGRLGGALHPGSLTVIGGRPSMGKTSLACNLLLEVTTARAPSLLFSLGSDRREVALNMMCMHARVDRRDLSHNRLPEERLVAASQAVKHLAELPIWISAQLRSSAQDIVSAVRNLHAGNQALRMVVVDDLLLMNGLQERAHQPAARQTELLEVLIALKALAGELDLALVVTTQLSRDIDRRVGHRPRLGDLPGGGSLEQEADVVILIHREEYYVKGQRPRTAELIVAKQLGGGETTSAVLAFTSAHMRFDNLPSSAESAEL